MGLDALLGPVAVVVAGSATAVVVIYMWVTYRLSRRRRGPSGGQVEEFMSLRIRAYNAAIDGYSAIDKSRDVSAETAARDELEYVLRFVQGEPADEPGV